jgi:hypothetical protein
VGDGSGVCAFSESVANRQSKQITNHSASLASVEVSSKMTPCLKYERRPAASGLDQCRLDNFSLAARLALGRPHQFNAGYGRTIDCHKPALPAWAGIVNSSCDYFLACARLALNEDSTVYGRNGSYVFEHGPELRGWIQSVQKSTSFPLLKRLSLALSQ